MEGDLNFEVSEVLTPFERLENTQIIIEDGFIEEVNSGGGFSESSEERFSSCIAVPGFIDIHMHGYGGNDTSSANPEELKNISEGLVKHGVTSIFPTTVSESEETLLGVAEAFNGLSNSKVSGSKLAGLHLEGPHFGEGEEKGAQNPDVLRPPSVSELERLYDASGGTLERVTLAPELPGSIDYIKKAKSLDLVVSAGHTTADFDQTNKAIKSGISIINHLFNGMKSFHHREPGIIGSSLTNDDVYAELIADMIHLHPASIEMAIRSKGLDGIVLISDSISATGLPDGEYELGGQEIVIDDGVSRMKDSGRLAGSTLTLDEAVKNVYENLDLKLRDIIRLVSYNPAKAMGLQNRGKIEQGYRGDIVLLGRDLEVIATIVDGNLVYSDS